MSKTNFNLHYQVSVNKALKAQTAMVVLDIISKPVEAAVMEVADIAAVVVAVAEATETLKKLYQVAVLKENP